MSLGLKGSPRSHEDTVSHSLLRRSPVTKSSSTDNQSEERGGTMGDRRALAVRPLKIVAEQEPVLTFVVGQPGAEVTDLHVSEFLLEWVSHCYRRKRCNSTKTSAKKQSAIF